MSADKDPARVIAGLKSAIHNPNTSNEAKERAAERLETMGSRQERESRSDASDAADELTNRQAGGYKATLHNDRASEEAKEHAREILEAAGYPTRPVDSTEEEHQTRVLAGYKAAIHNPRVSEEAKAHARQVLEDYGEA